MFQCIWVTHIHICQRVQKKWHYVIEIIPLTNKYRYLTPPHGAPSRQPEAGSGQRQASSLAGEYGSSATRAASTALSPFNSVLPPLDAVGPSQAELDDQDSARQLFRAAQQRRSMSQER